MEEETRSRDQKLLLLLRGRSMLCGKWGAGPGGSSGLPGHVHPGGPFSLHGEGRGVFFPHSDASQGRLCIS